MMIFLDMLFPMSNDGNRMVVGAKLDDTPGTNAGSVEVYEYSSGSWTKMGSTINRRSWWR